MTTSYRDQDYEYEGMTMLKGLFPSSNLDKIKAAVFDDSDIIVTTYPKCGTTWMQEIVYQVSSEGDFEGSNKVQGFEQGFYFLESTQDNVSHIEKALEKDPPRFLKTHLSSHFYKRTLQEKKTKFIVVFRNPKDMLASFFNFYKAGSFDFDKNGTWEEFFERFKNDKLVYGNYFDVQLSWWAYRDDPRVVILTYEDMLKDPEKAIRKVAAHLNKELSDELVMKIVQHTSFLNMKENPMLNYAVSTFINQEISPFMRKGQIGDWKNYFTEEQRIFVDSLSKQKFEAEGIFLVDQ